MKRYILAMGLALVGGWGTTALADDLTTLDGHTYPDIKNVLLKPAGLFFTTGTGATMKGVTVPYTNLTEEVKAKYHYDGYNFVLLWARQNQTVNLSKNLAFSLDQLEAAKKKAAAEKKYLGFIMEWDSMLVPAEPMGRGSDSGLAHFYDVFHENLVLVFVRHESELGKVPEAVKVGFNGPEEGGFAPNMAVVTADCSQFICEIPYGGEQSNGQIREQIFRQKIAVINQFKAAHPDGKEGSAHGTTRPLSQIRT
ncbi:MAG TPA: hypothetical protein VF607_08095 [Verrucomicrobiae bacterium]